MNNIRVFFIGGFMAYRALFAWIHWSIYVPTMLGSPLFQILFFAYVGRFAGLQDDAFFVVGNAVQVACMAGIYGMAQTIGAERWTQTLSPLLATPANRFALFMGRALPNFANGLIVSTFGFLIGWVFLDFDPPLSSLPGLAACVLVSAASCTAFGMLIGSIGLRARDVMFLANLAYFLLLLFCGVNVPLDQLPDWMEAIGRSLPLTHGIEAAREVAGGAPLSAVDHLLWTEAAIGAVYAFGAYGLFRYFESAGRRRASLETI
ncbi:MAG TPA: ABC transporter permease [Gaiellaceae bacterium]|nr:ABC transporter permease [Gaiellaceae bacterium]